MPDKIVVTTCEMHTAGEPLRIVESGYPKILGKTILEKINYAKMHLDNFRCFLMNEPRGHRDMYGAVFVEPDNKDANFAVLFLNNQGYSTMCGHAVIALARYAVDNELLIPIDPRTEMTIQCPCGNVKAFVDYKDGKSGAVTFHSVPAFVLKIGAPVQVKGLGSVTVDIAYGGALYAIVVAKEIGLNVEKSSLHDLIRAASSITDGVQKQVHLEHPDSSDLAFLYGTILIDDHIPINGNPTRNICVFADDQVDRSPTGSGVTARIALMYKKGYISLHQSVNFESRIGTTFKGKAFAETKCGQYDAVTVAVEGEAYYTGKNTFTMEENDPLQNGFKI